MQQRERHRDSLAPAEREGVAALVQMGVEVEQADHVVDPIGGDDVVVPQPAHQLEVLPRGQLFVERRRVGHQAHVPAGALTAGGHRLDEHVAAGRREQTGDGAQQGGLARPVAPHEQHALAGGDDGVDPGEHDVTGEADVGADLKHGNSS